MAQWVGEHFLKGRPELTMLLIVSAILLLMISSMTPRRANFIKALFCDANYHEA